MSNRISHITHRMRETKNRLLFERDVPQYIPKHDRSCWNCQHWGGWADQHASKKCDGCERRGCIDNWAIADKYKVKIDCPYFREPFKCALQVCSGLKDPSAGLGYSEPDCQRPRDPKKCAVIHYAKKATKLLEKNNA
jgi:hypothetical protein